MKASLNFEPFYGRAKGRRLRAAEASALAENSYLLDEMLARGNLRSCFPAGIKDIHLEIGFGAGEHLIERAKENPHIGFIGAEVFINGVAKCALSLKEANLDNVRLWPWDVRPLLDVLPAQSFNGLYLLYPDPWPKRRHWKRRIINDANLARFARLLKPGAAFYFATDWANYAAWGLAHLLRSPYFIWEAGEAADWLTPYEGWVSTRYEQKALRQGHTPSYFTFLRC